LFDETQNFDALVLFVLVEYKVHAIVVNDLYFTLEIRIVVEIQALLSG
jgi:hypothetical protein